MEKRIIVFKQAISPRKIRLNINNGKRIISHIGDGVIMARGLSEAERVGRVLTKLENFRKSNSAAILDRAEIVNQEISSVTPDDLFKQFTI
ncbi:MAG: hypothetical protein WC379_16615 [Methanoregula sp.]